MKLSDVVFYGWAAFPPIIIIWVLFAALVQNPMISIEYVIAMLVVGVPVTISCLWLFFNGVRHPNEVGAI